MEKVKLLIVVNEPKFFLSHRLNLALAAREAGFEVHIATADEKEAARIKELGFEFHPYRIAKYSVNPFSDLLTLIDLLLLYRRITPRIVHHVSIKPIIYGSLAARFVPQIEGVVNAVSGLGYIFLQKGIRSRLTVLIVKLLYRIALSGHDSILITQNVDDEDFILKSHLAKPEQLRRIRGAGVDPDQFSPQSKDQTSPCVVLMVSRLLKEKGVREFVAAASALRTIYQDVRFVLVGEWPQANPGAVCYKELQEWQAKGVIEYLGFEQEMPSLYHQADIVCLPSYREGLPKVLVEAAACAKPIVATDVAGCREIVRHGENGFLVQAQSVSSLVDALEKLIRDTQLRVSFGSKSREIFLNEGFTQQTVIEQQLAIYREILSDLDLLAERNN